MRRPRWHYQNYFPMNKQETRITSHCMKRTYSDQNIKDDFAHASRTTEFKIRKNNHYTDHLEYIRMFGQNASWEPIFTKLPLATQSKEIDIMLAYVFNLLKSPKKRKELTLAQWATLVDASAFADIEITSVGFVVPISERNPCCNTGKATLQILDFYCMLNQFETIDGASFKIFDSALKVFHMLRVANAVKTVFEKYMLKLAHGLLGEVTRNYCWKFLHDFLCSVHETAVHERDYCLAAINIVVDCTIKLCDVPPSKAECEIMSGVLQSISRICTYFALRPYDSPQEDIVPLLRDSIAVKNFLTENSITQRILEGPFSLLDKSMRRKKDPLHNEIDGENDPNSDDPNPPSSDQNENEKMSYISYMLQISSTERSKQTLELYHSHCDHRSIHHYESVIIYHLTGQLQSNLSESNQKSFRTAAVETLREMTLECGERKLGSLIKRHNCKFQHLHRAVICALCHPYFVKCSSELPTSDVMACNFSSIRCSPSTADVFVAYQIFLIHRNYGYLPEKIAMNALLKAMSERGEAAVFNIVDVTVQNHKGRPTNNGVKHHGVRYDKCVDYFTIEYMMKTCLVAKDTERARQLYWIMCEQFPGMQYRMTNKTKEYLTNMGVSNFSPSHIFTSGNTGNFDTKDIPIAE